ncbi:hypothetical protein [Nocardia transvalensis]|uniref:hypothetical protein n=1 Tax=Nocardia transvalensis TaxID=37333 RepID=UPI001895737B|nr:hypothetical protein [Nocardia transvalensis]MBF6327653.1 hypothetical protein [Nocardia transvalensis]
MTENKLAYQLQVAKARLEKLLGSTSTRGPSEGPGYRARGGFGRVEHKLRSVFKR